jgi:hypothetical protein
MQCTSQARVGQHFCVFPRSAPPASGLLDDVCLAWPRSGRRGDHPTRHAARRVLNRQPEAAHPWAQGDNSPGGCYTRPSPLIYTSVHLSHGSSFVVQLLEEKWTGIGDGGGPCCAGPRRPRVGGTPVWPLQRRVRPTSSFPPTPCRALAAARPREDRSSGERIAPPLYVSLRTRISGRGTSVGRLLGVRAPRVDHVLQVAARIV